MNKLVSSKSPAKINLFLDIKKKRKDGFHEIETIFEKIEIFDFIELKVLPYKKSIDNIKIRFKGFNIPVNNTNTIYRAAKLFIQTTGIKANLEFFVHKNIPPGSGLGGASSNAATVIKLLNKTFKTNLNINVLYDLAANIGSDVPFFITDYSFALGKGRGEKLSRINSDISLFHILFFPELKINSKQAYALFDKYANILTKQSVDVKLIVQALIDKNKDEISKNMYNCFENVLINNYKKLKYLIQVVKELKIKNLLLTGSGSAFYSIYFSQYEALKVIKKIKLNSPFPFLVKGPIKTF